MKFTFCSVGIRNKHLSLLDVTPSQAMGMSFPLFIPSVWQRAQYICSVTMLLALGDDHRDGMVVTLVLSGKSYLYLAFWISLNQAACFIFLFIYFLGKAVNMFTVILLRRLRKI